MDQQLFSRLVSIRRQLHQNPELGFREYKTGELIEDELKNLQIPTEKVASTGIIGTLRKGEGPTVVLRADMDALPVLEDTGLPYRSLTDGVMHACGHDLHTTMVLGAAHLLHDRDFRGTVKFLFQPAEESPLRSPVPGKSGGQLIAESGKLDGAHAALGLHVHPLIPVGQLAWCVGEFLANVGNFSIHIHGRGGHPGAMKHVIDPVVVAGQLISEARLLVGPQPDPPNAVFAITHVESLAKPSFNVIPSEVLLQGSMRALSFDVYNEVIRRLNQLLKSLEERYKCRIELEFSAYYPSLLNDEGVHASLVPVHEKIFGKDNIVPGPVYLIGEDFSFYSRMMPAQFYYLGAKAEENEEIFLHHPKVTFDENAMQYGATFLAEGALQLMSQVKL